MRQFTCRQSIPALRLGARTKPQAASVGETRGQIDEIANIAVRQFELDLLDFDATIPSEDMAAIDGHFDIREARQGHRVAPLQLGGEARLERRFTTNTANECCRIGAKRVDVRLGASETRFRFAAFERGRRIIAAPFEGEHMASTHLAHAQRHAGGTQPLVGGVEINRVQVCRAGPKRRTIAGEPVASINDLSRIASQLDFNFSAHRLRGFRNSIGGRRDHIGRVCHGLIGS